MVSGRWSFAFPGADFGNATVRMVSRGSSVPLTQEPSFVGYGENALVWNAAGITDGDVWPRVEADTPYRVVVSNVLVDGQARQFEYRMTLFDPTK